MSEAKQLIKKTMQVLRSDGIKGVQKRAKRYVKIRQEAKNQGESFKDVLFINGCHRDLLPQSVRYRVDHQKEQLESFGLSCDEVYYQNISLKQVRLYRTFILFRCVYTKELENFVEVAKMCNKKVYYDVDDLVFDTRYTNLIPSLNRLSEHERAQYDKDVELRKRILLCCNGAITTTKRLKVELQKLGIPVFINPNSASMEMVGYSLACKKEQSDKVKIGYFSGSKTHSDDLYMILPVLEEVLSKYPQVELFLTGELDLPQELFKYHGQITMRGFVNWKELPDLISQMDINLAPLCDTLFNDAKSEIKWMEASFVKTCTVASRVGAFKEKIDENQTGILCSTTQEWIESLSKLIENPNERTRLAQNAYNKVMERYITIYNGYKLADFIKKERSPNILFAMPKVEISGGIMVAFRHMNFLRKSGNDVGILSLYDDREWCDFLGDKYPILPLDVSKIQGQIDRGVATMWPTVSLLEEISTIQKRLYLVQNFETDFYNFSDPLKKQANQSYCPKSPFRMITVSKWCQQWLRERFGQDVKWAPNGIDLVQFQSKKRGLKNKIRILVEGDCQAEHKNVDESFHIVELLDPDKYEVWYMSYNAKPKDWYRVDRFFHRVPYEQVPNIYAQCDILLKTSLLESFSYPPLEMMATGGYVVALENDGNKEYLKDGYNVLFYPKGLVQEAKRKIENLVQDINLQETLYENGLKTVQERDWDEIRDQVLSLYQ